MGLSNKLSCEAGSFSHCLNPHRIFQSEGFRGFLSSHWKPGLHGLSRSPVYPHANVALPSLPATAYPGPPATALLGVLSTPPTRLDECFFFKSLAVGLPYSSIFWQFWLFSVFNLLLSFFWLCKEAKCIYLCLHLGWKSPGTIFSKRFYLTLQVKGLVKIMTYHKT